MNRDTVPVAWNGRSMGGHLGIRIEAPEHETAAARAAATRIASRVEVWAARLTRFSDTSDLARLNVAVANPVQVGPTLGAVLCWGAIAEERSGRIVDVTQLDARLAAEAGVPSDDRDAVRHQRDLQPPMSGGRWSIDRRGRELLVNRKAGVRFDLDGVAKGWIADRALDLLDRWPAAVVDADGDVALATSPGTEWMVEIENPLDRDGLPLAALQIKAAGQWRERLGVATSGTSVHRWGSPTSPGTTAPLRHHLIDPRTQRPAVTDLLQATVVAPSTAEAEMLAKAAVILGSDLGTILLERSNAVFGLLVREDGTTINVARSEWMAAA